VGRREPKKVMWWCGQVAGNEALKQVLEARCMFPGSGLLCGGSAAKPAKCCPLPKGCLPRDDVILAHFQVGGEMGEVHGSAARPSKVSSLPLPFPKVGCWPELDAHVELSLA